MKNSILIADCGSTKAEWGILSDSGTEKILTQGMSPFFLKTEQVKSLLQQELLTKIKYPREISEVYFYGTGCTAPGTCNVIFNALTSLFTAASVYVTYDLVAAAHALCGHNRGIACILGTGSNSCYYNGEVIERNSPGLGYILGDEGSGAYLGKIIITEFLYGKLDKKIEDEFQERFEVDKDTLLENVYSSSLPNRYLGSFSLFFSENRGNLQLENLLKSGLDAFFKTHLVTYPQSQTVPVHFTGSAAWAYRDILLDLCKTYGFQAGKIIKEPIDDLLNYYRQGK